jgi:two-component system chemotaxis response regulator CheB
MVKKSFTAGLFSRVSQAKIADLHSWIELAPKSKEGLSATSLEKSDSAPKSAQLKASPAAHQAIAHLQLTPPEIVVVGTSLGGLYALKILLAGIPANFPIPVVVVQHRYQDSDPKFSTFLQQYSPLPLKEVEDKEAIKPGYIYVAPADYHLLVEAGQAEDTLITFALSTEAPVVYARPSIDVLFESAADAYPEKIIGVILTGASKDGAKGLAAIKEQGGYAIVQEPSTAESSILPTAAIAAVVPDWILPLEKIAPLLVQLCQPRKLFSEVWKSQQQM